MEGFNEMTTIKTLKKYKFEYEGRIYLDNNELKIVLCDSEDIEDCVYMWADFQNNGKIIPLYIGKARSLIARVKSHEKGFTGDAGTGHDNRIYLASKLNDGKTLKLYVRKSCYFEIDEKRFPRYSSEEDAFIKIFNPELNIHRKIIIKGKFTNEGLLKKFKNDKCRQDILKDYFKTCETAKIKLFTTIYKLLEGEKVSEFDVKIVKSYTGVTKYEGKPHIVFCRVHDNGNAIAGTWLARIPLVCKPWINLPAELKCDDRNDIIELTDNDTFSPCKIGEFTEDPYAYVDKDKLERFFAEKWSF